MSADHTPLSINTYWGGLSEPAEYLSKVDSWGPIINLGEVDSAHVVKCLLGLRGPGPYTGAVFRGLGSQALYFCMGTMELYALGVGEYGGGKKPLILNYAQSFVPSSDLVTIFASMTLYQDGLSLRHLTGGIVSYHKIMKSCLPSWWLEMELTLTYT